MASLVWETVYGRELQEALSESRLEDVVPNLPAIYIWRRDLTVPPGASGSAKATLRWVEEQLSHPAASISATTLTHCTRLDGITIGGLGLTPEKTATLSSALENSGKRAVTLEYTQSLSDFLPPIYVGKTERLAKRVRQHLRGETSLQEYIQGPMGIAFDDVRLTYLKVSDTTPLSDASRRYLDALELIAQRLLVPFGTDRPG